VQHPHFNDCVCARVVHPLFRARYRLGAIFGLC
jgi:hypothetical protein